MITEKWITDRHPQETGEYLVSIKRQRTHGIQIFKYIAHYNAEENKWYKYDPFQDEKPSQELDNITAWSENLKDFSTFAG